MSIDLSPLAIACTDARRVEQSKHRSESSDAGTCITLRYRLSRWLTKWFTSPLASKAYFLVRTSLEMEQVAIVESEM